MHKERGGIGDILIILFGIALLLLLIGFFRNDPGFWGTFNYKTVLRLPCGLTVSDPKSGAKAAFPFVVDGYINGCGWDASGASAGTAQIFDGTGIPVTAPATLAIPSGSNTAPYSFEAYLTLIAPPHSASGYVLIKSNSGLLDSVPVAF